MCIKKKQTYYSIENGLKAPIKVIPESTEATEDVDFWGKVVMKRNRVRHV